MAGRALAISTFGRSGTFWGDVTGWSFTINAAVAGVLDVVHMDGNSTSAISTLWFFDMKQMGQSCWPDHPGEVGWRCELICEILQLTNALNRPHLEKRASHVP